MVSDAHRLAAHLGPMPEPVTNPVLVALSGLPGTGKSFVAGKLAERLPVLVLESDALRKTLFARPSYSPEESTRLFQASHYLVESWVKRGISIVIDATNLTEKYREPLYGIAERLGIKLVMVRTKAQPSIIFERLQRRTGKPETMGASDADWSVYVKMKPTVQIIKRKHYVIDTSRDITPVMDKIVQQIRR